MQGEMFAEDEDFGEYFHLYIIVEGVAIAPSRHELQTFGDLTDMASLTKKGMAADLKRPGSVWGEDHLLLTNAELLPDNTVVAVTFLQTQTLTQRDFQEIVDF